MDDGATEGDAVGRSRLTANDANNDRLTYSLEAAAGDAAAHADLFQIDRMTGQVTVGLGKTVHPAVVTLVRQPQRVPGVVLVSDRERTSW